MTSTDLTSSSSHNDTALASLVQFEFCRDHLVLPLERGQSAAGKPIIRCLSARPEDGQALDNLAMFLGAPLELITTEEIPLRQQIGQVYQRQMAASNALSQAGAAQIHTDLPDVALELAKLNDRDLLATGDKEPVAKLVDALLFDALEKNASDVHVHPYAERLQVRYRKTPLPLISAPTSTRIKFSIRYYYRRRGIAHAARCGYNRRRECSDAPEPPVAAAGSARRALRTDVCHVRAGDTRRVYLG